MDKNVQIIKDFIEEKITFEEFEKICKFDNDFRAFLIKYKNIYLKNLVNYSFLAMIDKYNWNSILKREDIYESFHWLLVECNVKFARSDRYYNAAQKIYNLLPSWLSDDASDYVDVHFLENMPEGMTQAQKKAWLKERIKETFKYEKRPPNWAQGGEWPRMPDGRFMTFRSQKSDGDLEIYTFVNPDTGEEVKVEEYY